MGVPGENLRPQGSLQCRGVGRGRWLTPLSGYQSIQCYKNYDDDWSTVINDDDNWWWWWWWWRQWWWWWDDNEVMQMTSMMMILQQKHAGMMWHDHQLSFGKCICRWSILWVHTCMKCLTTQEDEIRINLSDLKYWYNTCTFISFVLVESPNTRGKNTFSNILTAL